MTPINIDHWIDMNSADFQRVERHTLIKRIVDVGIQSGMIKVDLAGYMTQAGEPVHAELDGKFVGLRYSAKALN